MTCPPGPSCGAGAAGTDLWPEVTTYRGDALVAVRHDVVRLRTDAEVAASEPT